MNLKIGIIFGGFSREREVSFAGGRTVYDNLNKTLFDPVPLFVDSFGNFILLDWEFIYKGSIRDFYPPADHLPAAEGDYTVYAESLGDLNPAQQEDLFYKLGRKVPHEELKQLVDFAFLCLHGPYGEDGRIQGLLEYLGIPYSGSGILSSSIGINKAVQKKLMKEAGFHSPAFFTLLRDEWTGEKNRVALHEKVRDEIGFPCVVKSAHQGSSIGVSILMKDDPEKLVAAIDQAFFIRRLRLDDWNRLSPTGQTEFIRQLADIREGIGIPVVVNSRAGRSVVYHPAELLKKLRADFSSGEKTILLESCDAESEVLIEGFIEGKEFSCIVIRNTDNSPVALPPTGIRKGNELFDYRSKYLPGLARKITPIDIPDEQIRDIRKACERLFLSLGFNVYARIDGFIRSDGQVFLNDPNTTSGMMPSSFFFHQAAEIGLNPSQFLTYIIRTSLLERTRDMHETFRLPAMLEKLDEQIRALRTESKQKIRVAVVMGGYSSERHISVESGRNVYEKLSSSSKYEPFPVFLSGNAQEHTLYQIPVNLMLKDNADDIREKIEHYSVHGVIREIEERCEGITGTYTFSRNVLRPRKISYAELAELADVVFIALHGRPGEDGDMQRHLEEVGLPYNGSGADASSITINKYETNEILRKHGFSVARHALANITDWKGGKENFVKAILKDYSFPFIAKPVDDGCSSAVKKIRNEEELRAFADLIFRTEEELHAAEAGILNLKMKEEFPRKQQFLIEELIERKGAAHFLEITGGLLTRMDDKGKRVYEVFEASEALSEGDVLSLEEKFLAGEGQNITPARYAKDHTERQRISEAVKATFRRAAELLGIEGYARIDAFVRIFADGKVEVVFIEVNSLPGMTPATCIFHQAAIAGMKPYQFIDRIIEYGMQRRQHPAQIH